MLRQQVPLAAGPWPTLDPFLFCVHHRDAYPAGRPDLGPAASLEGRALGQDFSGKDGWSMYHGTQVPGFPPHPHRGFETVTIARKGYIDHSDSLGATARFGQGDVQWLTAGAGIVHAEMFPLLRQDGPNPTELFQIWLNLPAAQKMAKPHFQIFWKEQLPRHTHRDAQGRAVEVEITAGAWGAVAPLAPPPESWASAAEAELAIWTLRWAPEASLPLPPTRGPETLRTLYLFEGELKLGDERVQAPLALVLEAQAELELVAGPRGAQALILQGRPIGEPVAQHGPFVMNTQNELMQAFQDYQRTQFGGWPWAGDHPVHPPEAGRFAQLGEGPVQRPPQA